MRFISIVLNTTYVQLYKENGESIILRSDDINYKRVVSEAVKAIADQGYYDFDLSQTNTESIDKLLTEANMSDITFIRVFKNLFNDFKNKLLNITDLFNSKNDSTEPLKEDETVVAAVKHTLDEDEVFIENIEKMEKQIKYAISNNNTQGIENLLKRLSKVKDEKAVQECIKFLEKADLPIANNGDIIAYKAVSTGPFKGVFVDSYTRTIRQKIGSIVTIDPNLIDPNKERCCSTGLHIASRNYMKDYVQDHCLLVAVRPEDIKVVPIDDSTKVRVSAYTVLDIFSSEEYSTILSNASLTELTSTITKISRAVENKYPDPIEEVFITKDEVLYTDIRNKQKKTEAEEPTKIVTPVTESEKFTKDEYKKLMSNSSVKAKIAYFNDLPRLLTPLEIADLRAIKRKMKSSDNRLGIKPHVSEQIKRK